MSKQWMGKLIVLVFLIMIWPFGWLTIPLAFFYCIIPAIKEIERNPDSVSGYSYGWWYSYRWQYLCQG